MRAWTSWPERARSWNYRGRSAGLRVSRGSIRSEERRVGKASSTRGWAVPCGQHASTASASFFFSSRRRHTRSKRDWSSDVCSSDLEVHARMTARKGVGDYTINVRGRASHAGVDFLAGASAVLELSRQIGRIAGFTRLDQIGRASCRESEQHAGVGGAVWTARVDGERLVFFFKQKTAYEIET